MADIDDFVAFTEDDLPVVPVNLVCRECHRVFDRLVTPEAIRADSGPNVEHICSACVARLKSEQRVTDWGSLKLDGSRR